MQGNMAVLFQRPTSTAKTPHWGRVLSVISLSTQEAPWCVFVQRTEFSAGSAEYESTGLWFLSPNVPCGKLPSRLQLILLTCKIQERDAIQVGRAICLHSLAFSWPLQFIRGFIYLMIMILSVGRLSCQVPFRGLDIFSSSSSKQCNREAILFSLTDEETEPQLVSGHLCGLRVHW